MAIRGFFMKVITWIIPKQEYEKQNQQHKQTIQQAQNEHQSLSNQAQQKRQEMTMAKSQAVELEKQTQLAKEKAELEKGYQADVDSANQFLQQSETCRLQIEQLQKEIESSEQALNQIQQDIQEKQSNCEQLKHQREPFVQEQSRCSVEISQKKTTLQQKQQEAQQLQNLLPIEPLVAETAEPTIPQAVENAEKNTNSAEVASGSATVALSVPAIDVEETQAKISALNDEIAILEQQIETLQAHIDSQWEQVKQFDQKIQTEEQELSSLNTQRQQYETQISQKQQALDTQNRNAENALREADRLHQQIVQKRQNEQTKKAAFEASENKFERPQGKWLSQYEAVVGLTHRKAGIPLPCQDAAVARIAPRAMIITADGAGSSAVSDIGSAAVVTGVARLINTLNPMLKPILDEEGFSDEYPKFAKLIVNHARGILLDLSEQHRRPMKDFRCTLLAAIVGEKKTLWLKVGDGSLVMEKRFKEGAEYRVERSTLGEVGKGEYANQTIFIDENLQPASIQSGVIDSAQISALFAMSDGAAERFVSNDGTRTAGKLSEWAELLRNDSLSRQRLTAYFYSDEFQKGKNSHHSGDDCSIAMIARA